MMSLEGRMLGGCKLIRKIGEGGMGQVYLGEQVRVGNRLVAVKVVQPGDAANAPGATEETERRFQREAALLGQFSHPNILPVHDSGIEDGLLYLVMQYAPAGSLSDAIRGRSAHKLELPASLAFTDDIIGQVADALQYTHSRGVVHRDVKPGNVLIRIEPNGHWHALLADFGIARAQDTMPQQTQVSGTLAYMAPEQFSGKFSPASDQYALAVMAYQLLAGRTPFEGDLATLTRGHMYEQPPSLRTFNAAVPLAVEQVINRALSKEPAQRYPSVAEFAQALRAASTGTVAQAAATPALAGVAAGAVSIPLTSSSETTDPNQAQKPAVRAGTPPPSVAGPQWPLPERPRSPGGLWRTWVAVLAALILLVAVIGASGLVARHQRQLNAESTQTAQAGTTAQAHASQAASQTAAAATATAIFKVPTATATMPIAADDTTPPPAPTGAGTLLISDPAPSCDQPAGPDWVKDNNTNVVCDGAGFPTISAQSSSSAACVELTQANQGTATPAAALNVANGYFAAIADTQGGTAILAFRVGNGQTTGSTTNRTEYQYVIDKANNIYALGSIDATGKGTVVKQGALPARPNTHFAMGVLFNGSAITLYLNGQQIATTTDSTFTQGWVGLCTTGTTEFRDAQIYQAS
jgi:serine/threonine protein kinase